MYKSWKLSSQQNLGKVKLEEAETESVDAARSEWAAGQRPTNPEDKGQSFVEAILRNLYVLPWEARIFLREFSH